MDQWHGIAQSPMVKGFALGASLIIAIGAQNAFVLRQGLKREHVFLIPLICALCDSVLIILGAEGLGSVLAQFPQLTKFAAWLGAAFLFFYGARSLYAALKPGKIELDRANHPKLSAKAVVMKTLAVSLLNPHAYVDTVFLVGSVAAQYGAKTRAQFTAGTICASVTWFFCLSYGASKMAPLLRTPVAWRILDLLIAIMMWSIGLSLLRGSFG